MRTLVIIPAYNEGLNIKTVVDNLIHNYSQYDYVVVNDGSRDNTSCVCRENNYNLLNLPVNLGLAGAFQAGMKYADLNKYDYALQFDGDGQHLPQYIQTLIDCANSKHADIVIGSRFVNKKKQKSLRMLGNNLISFILKITTHKKIHDPTSGMRLYSRSMIKEFAHYINYGPEPDTIAFLLRKGVRCEEVQVEMADRLAGESYLNLKNSIKYMCKMMISILLFQWARKRGV